jgi:hypothetical protein
MEIVLILNVVIIFQQFITAFVITFEGGQSDISFDCVSFVMSIGLHVTILHFFAQQLPMLIFKPRLHVSITKVWALLEC